MRRIFICRKFTIAEVETKSLELSQDLIHISRNQSTYIIAYNCQDMHLQVTGFQNGVGIPHNVVS